MEERDLEKVDAESRRLLERFVKEGHRPSFDELYRLHAPALRAFARAHFAKLGFKSDLEELVEELSHETWVVVARRAWRFEGESRFRTWLVGVAKNVAKKIFERRKRRSHAELDEAMPVPEPATPPAVTAAVREAIDALPAEDRELVDLRYRGGLTFEELAAKVGKPLGSIRRLLKRVEEKLRPILERKDLGT